jgi:hypothetical protein
MMGMRKSTRALLVLVFLTAPSVVIFLPVKANPYMYHKSVSAPSYVKPPNITIASPKENGFYTSNETINLCFNVTGPDAANLLTKYLTIVEYKGDWMQEAKQAYRTKNFETYTPDDFPFFLEFNFNLIGIPEGRHTIVITAVGAGGYAESLTWYHFGINSSSSVDFTVYTIPVVSFLSFENRTFKTSDIPLNFIVNQPVSKITYCLDRQENVTITGNTTLTELSNGDHNVTIYATNEAGKTGVSETITFTIAKPELQPEPFPKPIFVAPIVSAAFVGAGLLVYFKKRKR